MGACGVRAYVWTWIGDFLCVLMLNADVGIYDDVKHDDSMRCPIEIL